MRLQKYLASVSSYSRRKLEQMIDNKIILINGKIAKIGIKVNAGDVISMEGKQYIVSNEEHNTSIIAYYKPIGELCTQSDTHARPIVFQALPKCPNGKWISIGRLDINSEGLLLFCNNGELANKMMHPSANWLRVYKVRVYGEVKETQLTKLLKGVMLDGQMCKFNTCEQISSDATGKNTWYQVSVYTGKYRMVRRLWEHIGLRVNRLIRLAYGPIKLTPKDKPGDINWLEQQRVDALIRQLS